MHVILTCTVPRLQYCKT